MTNKMETKAGKFEKRRKFAQDLARTTELRDRMDMAITADETELLNFLNTSREGLDEEEVIEARDKYGDNVVTHGKVNPLWKRIASAFINPFTAILTGLAIVSVFTDIILAAPEDRSYATVIIISLMVMISGLLRFVQETRSGNAAAQLQKMIHTTASVKRELEPVQEINMDEIVVGDIIRLSAGDMVPADIRILEAKDLFISQAALTGESEPIEKMPGTGTKSGAITDQPNLAFMGSNVVSGSALGVAAVTGNSTLLGRMAKTLNQKPPKTSFEKGVNSISWVLIRFMLIMVPVVFIINGLTKGDWLAALLFAISIAVGLTPEMLPMIVTTSLAKGAVAMSKKKVIIKNLNAIQNLGSMDILCTDKTGTLTQDKVVLEYYMDIHGNEDLRILRHAYLNSYFQTGLKNLIDLAIIARQDSYGSEGIQNEYHKVDEIPFDFSRRRMSVVVADTTGKTQLVTKGAVEEMLKCCSYAELDGQVTELTDETRDFIISRSGELNEKGMRVLAVAQKTNPRPAGQFSVADESDMVLIGFLALLDPPKETTPAAIQALNDHGVAVKILTGDNERVTQSIASQVGMETGRPLLGSEIDEMTDRELGDIAKETTVFAKLSPEQKARVVKVLREDGHVVGFMGDGINDAAAMQASDAGISVDTAVDIAKESADVILLEKDLTVLEDGILEGRKTYANMIKYIKMTASSNFGNMFSVLAASAFLPFLPMAALHLILLNLVYDLSCTAIPWDNVDEEYLLKPSNWNAKSVSRFMIWLGPVSSVFDILTYLLMYFIICPMFTGGKLFTQLSDPGLQMLYIGIFQAGWFIESMWSQTLVIHMLRTAKFPFVQSRASLPVVLLTMTGISVITVIPFTVLGLSMGFRPLPEVYFFWLALIIIGYMLLTTLIKHIYVKRYGSLL